MKRVILLVLVAAISLSAGTSEEKIKSKAKRIHKHALTIDSHVDTPMWLMREGYDFSERHDPYTLPNKLDLPRMDEGELDGVFFAVFIGQGERTPEGNAKAYKDAHAIIDSIESTADRYSRKMEIVTKEADLNRMDKEGKHAIYLGMENGYPLGTELSLVDTFYNRGIRYITLTHSYNNDICDSSTDSTEHGGLSDFGRQVVRRMNELGVMIDLSHASDETFYQVVEMSDKPVIASHSCARALCDHPRNLTDDMLRKLKENNGVIQMCILSAYVKTPKPNPQRDSARQAVREKHGDYYSLDDKGKEAFLEDWYKVDRDFPRELATVSDVVDHIDHIVEVAGIDHVGIGTDFDGGGGVEDCYDVSQLGNITEEMVRRGYSRRDIRKIWSDNLLRVMKANEKG